MDRSYLELPPLRTRLADAWPFAAAFFGLLLGPFFVFPLTKILLGWLIGAGVYLAIRLIARRPLYDFISSDSEFGLDSQGHVHVLSNEREALTPLKEWDLDREMRHEFVKIAVMFVIVGIVSFSAVALANHWDEAIVLSAFAASVIVLSIAEPLQQVRGRRSFRDVEGGVVLNPQVFGGLFRTYVESDRFDPNDRTPHIDTVLEAALEHLDPAQRAEALVETKRKMMDRSHAGMAAGSLGKILRIFGG
ncbi:MAG: hypothetical protein M3N53_02945 [Actinomycetota bacterium]|nr:hypothetical protein [Actinomycetota bacterium]